MSLIALIANRIVVGDILITSTDNKDKTVELPTILREPKFIADIGPSPNITNLKQKIYVINDHLALSLAGSVYEMKEFLQDFKNYFKYKETNFGEIESFIKSYDLESISKILIGILYFTGKGFFHFEVGPDWKKSDKFIFGELAAAGTGAQSYIDELSMTLEMYGSIDLSGDTHAQERWSQLKARVFTQNLTFLFKERFFGSTAIESWGGGFEMICFENGVFKKMNDFLYLIVNCKFDNNGNLLYGPLFLINHNYYGDVLLLTCTVEKPRYADPLPHFHCPRFGVDNQSL